MTARVVTFYSYKGGVGRTQALANVAVRLANRGERVIVVDMDLESPGIHPFFSPPDEETRSFNERDFADKPGVLDYLERCSGLPAEEPSIEGMLVLCAHRYLRPGAGTIHLLPPGRLDDTYVERLAAFSWGTFYSERYGYAYLELMRSQLSALADVLLVDSRTGLTDVGMVCTFQLPDVIVVLFALHQQGIDGARRIAEAIAARGAKNEAGGQQPERGRRVLLVPSRVDDDAEVDLAAHWLSKARKQLQGIARSELLDGHRDRLPYLARFAYGENVVDPTADNRLSDAYEQLTSRMVASSQVSPASVAGTPRDDDVPLFVKLARESAQIRNDATELVRLVHEPWDPDAPIDQLSRRTSDLRYRQAELASRIAAVEDLLVSFARAAELPAREVALSPPQTLAQWATFPDTLDSAIREVRSKLEQGESIDALIVTAIKAEYDEVLKVNAGAWPDSTWEVRKGPLGLDVAFRLFTAANGQPLQVAVTWATDMGGVATASAAERLIAVYSPRCIAMCGVCAGRRGDVSVGDVIIADRLWMYDVGKVKVEIGDGGKRTERVQGDMLTYVLRPDWKQRAEAFVLPAEAKRWLAERPRTGEAQADWILERLAKGEDPRTHADLDVKAPDFGKVLELLWKKKLVDDGSLNLSSTGRKRIERLLLLHHRGLPEPAPFKVHVGPIGSGNKVVQDPEIFGRLSNEMRKVLGLEMEEAAIGAIGHLYRDDIRYMVVMKGVMDHADDWKTDAVKSFAARASAECLLAFLRENLPPVDRFGDILAPGTSPRPGEP